MRKKFSFREFWRTASGTTLDHLRPFLVGIGWDFELVTPREGARTRDEAFDRQSVVRTGFLVELDRVMWLVTAGHVITDILKSTTGTRRLVSARLYDGAGSDGRLLPIPFPLNDVPKFHVDREELGLDIGAIQVHGHWARLLRAGGAQPFTPNTWAKEGEQFDTFVLLGFPEEHAVVERRRIGRATSLRVSLGTPLLPLRMLKQPPVDMRKKYSRFYAKVRRSTFRCGGRTIHVNDIKGMSGGPVIGLRIGKSIAFRIIAVQSSWMRSRKTIAACPISDFIHVVQERLRARYPEAFVDSSESNA